jgi:hypothetical protein
MLLQQPGHQVADLLLQTALPTASLVLDSLLKHLKLQITYLKAILFDSFCEPFRLTTYDQLVCLEYTTLALNDEV